MIYLVVFARETHYGTTSVYADEKVERDTPEAAIESVLPPDELVDGWAWAIPIEEARPYRRRVSTDAETRVEA